MSQLAKWFKRQEHQALSVLVAAARENGHSDAQIRAALEEYVLS